MTTDTVRQWRLLPPDYEQGWIRYAWLVYLGALFIEPVIRRADAAYWAATVAGALVFLVAYFRGHWVHGQHLLAIIAFIALLGVGYSPFNTGASVFFVYAATFAVRQDNQRLAIWLLSGLTLLGIVMAWLTRAPWYYWSNVVIFTPLIGLVGMHFAKVARTNARLKLAHEEIHHLAAVAERERIARDLHDVLGHTLSLITIKAELAGKIIERDPARAAREIRDVEQVSRTALSEVREAIRGYRASLVEEASRAQSILVAAGVEPDLQMTNHPLDPASDEVFAFALRELVTNVARHARATCCRVTLEEQRDWYVLTIADNGTGANGQEGSGLRGVRERLESSGGSLQIERRSGTTVIARTPRRDSSAIVPRLRVVEGGQG